MSAIASSPEPPYTAVIFTSLKTPVDGSGYAAAVDRMETLAREQPGYLGIESARDPASRLGITVSYWVSEEAARAWKAVAEHREVQRMGREKWYASYAVRVATVTRDYRFGEGD